MGRLPASRTDQLEGPMPRTTTTAARAMAVRGRRHGHRDRGRRIALKPGVLLVIEKQERHEIRNTGDGLLKTLNFHYPPAFTAGGNPKGPGKRKA